MALQSKYRPRNDQNKKIISKLSVEIGYFKVADFEYIKSDFGSGSDFVQNPNFTLEMTNIKNVSKLSSFFVWERGGRLPIYNMRSEISFDPVGFSLGPLYP